MCSAFHLEIYSGVGVIDFYTVTFWVCTAFGGGLGVLLAVGMEMPLIKGLRRVGARGSGSDVCRGSGPQLSSGRIGV